jgi:phosphomannomutase
MSLTPTIFREHDIRGRAHVDGELTPANVRRIVNAFLAYKPTQHALIIGADHRPSSDEFRRIAVATALEAGREVVDIGTVTTPMLYFAQYYLHVPLGLMITASHDPTEWSGFILADGYLSTLSGDGLRDIRNLAVANTLPERLGEGEGRSVDLSEDYIHAITCRLRFGEKRLKVVVDCGNGTAGFIAPAVFERLGTEVIPLYCDPDPTFPNHSANPSDAGAREAARAAVRAHGADLALLFDGDGDRLGVINDRGEDVRTDQVMLLLSLRMLEDGQSPTVVFDISCTRTLEDLLSARGGSSVLWKSGYPHIRWKSLEAGADLAGEQRGHIFIFDRWFGFDDAVFAGACLLEYLSRGETSLSDRLLEAERDERGGCSG